jgi:hypothetical protein
VSYASWIENKIKILREQADLARRELADLNSQINALEEAKREYRAEETAE